MAARQWLLGVPGVRKSAFVGGEANPRVCQVVFARVFTGLEEGLWDCDTPGCRGSTDRKLPQEPLTLVIYNKEGENKLMFCSRIQSVIE